MNLINFYVEFFSLLFDLKNDLGQWIIDSYSHYNIAKKNRLYDKIHKWNIRSHLRDNLMFED